jgi:hypothetical protein
MFRFIKPAATILDQRYYQILFKMIIQNIKLNFNNQQPKIRLGFHAYNNNHKRGGSWLEMRRPTTHGSQKEVVGFCHILSSF